MRNSIFGWKSLIAFYGTKSLIKDCWLPIIISTVICVGTYYSTNATFDVLKTVIGLANDIVPSMIGLVLAAYTVLLTFFTSDTFKRFTGSEKGKTFVKGMNAGFAACLTFLALSVLSSMLITVCFEWGFTSVYANQINMAALFGISFLLSYSITSIFGIIIDIYNSGQTTTIT